MFLSLIKNYYSSLFGKNTAAQSCSYQNHDHRHHVHHRHHYHLKQVSTMGTPLKYAGVPDVVALRRQLGCVQLQCSLLLLQWPSSNLDHLYCAWFSLSLFQPLNFSIVPEFHYLCISFFLLFHDWLVNCYCSESFPFTFPALYISCISFVRSPVFESSFVLSFFLSLILSFFSIPLPDRICLHLWLSSFRM